MDSFFKILPSVLWEDSKITGLITQNENESEIGNFQVYRFGDLEAVCKQSFEPADYPIALEFAPESYPCEWLDSKSIKNSREGRIASEHLLTDLVLNIYSFEVVKEDDSFKFILQGE